MFELTVAFILLCVTIPFWLVSLDNRRYRKHEKICENENVWQGTWFDDCKCRYCEMFNKLVENNKLTDEDVEAMRIIGDSVCSEHASV